MLIFKKFDTEEFIKNIISWTISWVIILFLIDDRINLYNYYLSFIVIFITIIINSIITTIGMKFFNSKPYLLRLSILTLINAPIIIIFFHIMEELNLIKG